MQTDLFENSRRSDWGTGDEASSETRLRSDRDERAIRFVCHLLMAGVALERHVNAVPSQPNGELLDPFSVRIVVPGVA